MTKLEEGPPDEQVHCDSSYHMSDPWYMVHCQLKKGHKGNHKFSWKTGENRD